MLSGIWRPVKLDLWDEARLSNVHVRQRDVSIDLAHLVVETEITSELKTTAKIALTTNEVDRRRAHHATSNSTPA